MQDPTATSATQIPGPAPTTPRSGLPWRLVGLIVGALLILALGAFALLNVLAGSSRSEATAALEPSNSGVADLYLIGNPTKADEGLSRDNRLLRDVVVGGSFYRSNGGSVTRHESFDLSHDGKPIFAYREEDSDEWIIALADGGEVFELESIDSTPSVYFLESGNYIHDRSQGSCSVRTLSGRETARLIRADYCLVNPVTEAVITAERRSSDIEIAVFDLRSGESTELTDVDEDDILDISFAPDQKSVLLSTGGGGGGDNETALFNMSDGRVIAEDNTFGEAALNQGFLSRDDDGAIGVVDATGFEEIISTPDSGFVSAVVSPSGTAIAFAEFEGDRTIVSTATISNGQVSPVQEIEDFSENINLRWVDDTSLVVATSDGEVFHVSNGVLTDVGELDGGEFFNVRLTGTTDYAIVEISGNDSDGRFRSSTGVFAADGDRFAELRDLERIDRTFDSNGGNWVALTGAEDVDDVRSVLVLLNLSSLETVEVDSDDGFSDIRFSDDYLYYNARTGSDSDDVEGRRFKVGPNGSVEDLSDGARLLVPGVGRAISRPNDSFGERGVLVR